MNTLMMFAQTLVALAIVCGLAYVVLRWVLPRLQIAGASQSRLIKIVDLVALDANRKIYLVEMANRWMLISSSEAGVHLIKEFETDPTLASGEALKVASPHDDTVAGAAAAVARPSSPAALKRPAPASWAQNLAERFANHKRG